VDTADLTPIAARYGVPHNMRSCHTTVVDGYFIEGHVPIAAIESLLARRPAILGIALPGMPVGSPGMPGIQTEPLIVYAVSRSGISVFARFAPPR
jgi:hypothetical protein